MNSINRLLKVVAERTRQNIFYINPKTVGFPKSQKNHGYRMIFVDLTNNDESDNSKQELKEDI